MRHLILLLTPMLKKVYTKTLHISPMPRRMRALSMSYKHRDVSVYMLENTEGTNKAGQHWNILANPGIGSAGHSLDV